MPGVAVFNPAHNSRDAVLFDKALASAEADGALTDCACSVTADTTRFDATFWRLLSLHASLDTRARIPPCIACGGNSHPKVLLNRLWFHAFSSAWQAHTPCTVSVTTKGTTTKGYITERCKEYFMKCNESGGEIEVLFDGEKRQFGGEWMELVGGWERANRCGVEEVEAGVAALAGLVASEAYRVGVVDVEVVRKDVTTSFGFSLSTYGMFLVAVEQSSPAGTANLTRHIGRVLSAVDRTPVTSPEHAAALCSGKEAITLTLSLETGDHSAEVCSGCAVKEEVEVEEVEVEEVEAVQRSPVVRKVSSGVRSTGGQLLRCGGCAVVMGVDAAEGESLLYCPACGCVVRRV